MTKDRLKNILNKLHLKSPIISQTSFKVSFHNYFSRVIIVYQDVLITKKKYYNTINKKCGIYKWINKINGKSYVGS